MTYRCPYCKQEIGQTLSAHCPACGKVMRVPVRAAPERRRAKRRALDRIEREYQQKKADLQSVVLPALFRNPRFYFGAVLVLALIGAALFTATDRAVQKTGQSPAQRALRHLDVLAEALGRYRFHTGQFPDQTQGLAALVRNPHVPKWDGPYINLLRKDPWETPFVYASATSGLPTLFSCGPDKKPNTPDDLRPDPACFEPGTAWTNGWVSADQRLPGVLILPRAR
ncbi:MAG: type II secretion system protein GspG [bacterium]